MSGPRIKKRSTIPKKRIYEALNHKNVEMLPPEIKEGLLPISKNINQSLIQLLQDIRPYSKNDHMKNRIDQMSTLLNALQPGENNGRTIDGTAHATNPASRSMGGLNEGSITNSRGQRRKVVRRPGPGADPEFYDHRTSDNGPRSVRIQPGGNSISGTASPASVDVIESFQREGMHPSEILQSRTKNTTTGPESVPTAGQVNEADSDKEASQVKEQEQGND